MKARRAIDPTTYYLHMRSGEVLEAAPCDAVEVTKDEIRMSLKGKVKQRFERSNVYLCTPETTASAPGF